MMTGSDSNRIFTDQRVVGYIVHLRNSALEIDCKGTPLEVTACVLRKWQDITELVWHPDTQLTFQEYFLNATIKPPDRLLGQQTPLGLLATAVAEGDLAQVRMLLHQTPTDAQIFSIEWMAWNGLTEALRGRIKSRQDANLTGKFGLMPLHWAAANGHEDTIKFLLASGADPQARSEFLWAPMHVALANRHTHLLQLLGVRSMPSMPVDSILGAITLGHMGVRKKGEMQKSFVPNHPYHPGIPMRDPE